MKRRSQRASVVPSALAAVFVLGAAVGWWAHGRVAAHGTLSELFPRSGDGRRDITLPAPTRAAPAGAPEPSSSTPTATGTSGVFELLRARPLQLPVDDASVEAMRGQFGDPRDGGARGHEAVDIMAPRNTQVHAVDDGTIAKLFTSRAGGTTVYQFDPAGRFCYYYAHLESYAPGLHEGERVSRGQVIGFVGTSGNAPPNAPHLHFAIFQLNADRRWWEGTPLDPYRAFTR